EMWNAGARIGQGEAGGETEQEPLPVDGREPQRARNLLDEDERRLSLRGRGGRGPALPVGRQEGEPQGEIAARARGRDGAHGATPGASGGPQGRRDGAAR